MTQVVLPNRPIPGDPEDISQIMANFDAILTVLNGDVRNDNLAAGAAVAVSKLASGAAGDRLETIGAAVVWQKAAQARGNRAAVQSIAHATFTAITLTAEDWDNDTMLDVAGGTPSRIIAKTAGKFLVTAGVGAWGVNSTGPRLIEIRKNGATAFGLQEQPAATAPDQSSMATSEIIDLAVNDYVELVVYQSSGGGALNASACYLSAMRLSA